jgi:hypothetical protein
MKKNLIKFIKNILPLSPLKVLFCNDAHSIVSEKGWRVLNEKEK